MKKIVIIEAGSPGSHNFLYAQLPRLGFMIIGEHLKNHEYDVKLISEDISGKINLDNILDADLVGISSITCTAPRAYEIGDKIRKHGIPVVHGGPHVSFMAEEALLHGDFVIRGEGEEAMLELDNWIFYYQKHRDVSEIKGLSHWHKGEKKHNSDRPLNKYLDSLPIPDFSMLTGWKNKIWPIQTSRGCPFGCTFCAVTAMFGRQMRYRSIPNVVKELEMIKVAQPGHMFVYDDNFAANRERAKELLREMKKMNWTISWGTQVRIDVSEDPELLQLLKDTHCKYLYIGLESINPATLQRLNKSQSLKEMDEGIDKIMAYDINIHGMFIVGNEDDTPQTIKDTINFALKKRLATIQVSIMTPLPGTQIFAQFLAEGRLLGLGGNWYKWFNGHYPMFRPKNMSPLQLYYQVVKGMKKFYALSKVMNLVLNLKLTKVRVGLTKAGLTLYGRKALKKFEKSPNTIKFLQTIKEKFKS